MGPEHFNASSAAAGMSVITFNPSAAGKIHKCSICPKTFKRREHRLRHERSHAQERPYACRFCSRRYGRTDLVLRHEKSVHAYLWRPAHNGQQSTTGNGDVVAFASLCEQESDSETSACLHGGDPNMQPRQLEPTGAPSTEDMAASFPATVMSEIDEGDSNSQQLSAALDDGTLNDGGGGSSSSSSMALSLDFFDPFLGPTFGHFALPFSDQGNGIFEPLEGASRDDASGDIAFNFASLGDAGLAGEHQQVTAPPLLPAEAHPFIGAENTPGPSPERQCSPRIVRPATRRKHCFVFTDTITARLASNLRSRPGQDGLAPPFQLPEAGALQKCLMTYIDAFHVHFPLIHLPTLDLETASTPLIFAMCAVGAQYRLEHKIAATLYSAAQHALASPNVDLDQTKKSLAALPLGWAKPQSRPSRTIDQSSLALMQARWIVTFFEAFSGQPQLIGQALVDCGHISADLRMNRMLVSSGSSTLEHSTWTSWALRESLKRLLSGSMILNNLLSMAFGVGLGFDLLEESNIEMAVDDALWNAPSAAAWEAVAKDKPRVSMLGVREAVASLFDPHEVQKGLDGGCWAWSPFATSVVIHVVSLSVSCLRQGTQVLNAKGLHANKVSAALSRCRDLLLAAHPDGEDSWTDADGPLLFNAFAALRVTYGRAFMGDRCLDRSLLYMDCHEDMLAVMRRYLQTDLERNQLLTMAVVRSLKGFSIPIKSGLVLMRKTAALTSSIEQTLAGWDAALLVTKWTHTIECAQKSGQNVTPSESRTLNSICELLAEADIDCSQTRSVAAEVARIWASIYDDTWVWGVAPRIGWVLRELAHMYDQGLGSIH